MPEPAAKLRVLPTPVRRHLVRLAMPRAELLILAGIAAITAGVAWLYAPAGVIFGGVALVAAGVGEFRAPRGRS